MRQPDLAEPLKISVWDAEAVQENAAACKRKTGNQYGSLSCCRRCAKECGSDAITYVNKKAVIDYDKCKGCGRCIGACSFDAVYNPNDSANELLDRKMAEYAQAVCHDRPHFHIALVQDISRIVTVTERMMHRSSGYRNVRKL